MEYRFIPTHVGNTAIVKVPTRLKPVHPHACGEHLHGQGTVRLGGGSSPRMWGTLHHRSRGNDLFRFIPTHVGNTAGTWACAVPGAVHPHACGEHKSLISRASARTGSSPRMWGTPQPPRTRRVETRFIPTHVGNTCHKLTGDAQSAVHPHACGEHGEMLRRNRMRYGSSPRMWGTQGQPLAVNRDYRFIPTHVGNTM